jgi:[acyl-carrier-protein] S-malonyltransferase
LGLTSDVVKDDCRVASSVGVVAAANFNSPGQVVIAGEKAAVEQAIALAKEKGCKKAIPLPVSVPVHTPLMQRAADRLAKDLAVVQWSDLRAPLINNAEARTVVRAHEIQASLVLQLPSSVLWEDTIKTMGKMGVTTFVEVGPGTVLTGLIKRILPDARLLNVNDPKSLETTFAALDVKHKT